MNGMRVSGTRTERDGVFDIGGGKYRIRVKSSVDGKNRQAERVVEGTLDMAVAERERLRETLGASLRSADTEEFRGLSFDAEYGEDGRELFVYFMRIVQTGHVKIGFTVDVDRRLRTIAHGLPFDLELIGFIPGGPEREAVLHQRYRRCRVKGEWFMPDQSMLRALQSLAARGRAYLKAA